MAGLVSSGSAIAQTDLPLEIEQNAEDEYVVIRNIGDEEVDISNYQINFEAGEDSNVDQIRQLPSDVVIGAGDEIIVPTGVLEVSGDNVVQLTDPYDTEMLNNEDPDVVALLDPDDNVVVSTDETTDGGDGDDGDGDTDACTLTVTVTDSNGELIDGLPVVLATYDEGEEVARTTTDTNGKTRFDVKAGSYEIVEIVEDSEYTSYGTHPVDVRSDTEYSIQLPDAPEPEDDTDDGSDDTEDEDASGDAPDESGDETDESADETDDDCPKR